VTLILIVSLNKPSRRAWEITAMAENGYVGLLLIGDPHLEGRQPGFRKDDYPTVILDKLAWCLEYAESHKLLPAILGDLFDKPRDNPNWLLVRLLTLLRGEVIGLYGNHDVHYNPELTDDDSISVLVKAGRIRLVSGDDPWRGTIGGRSAVIGGSSYRQEIPKRYEASPAANENGSPLVVWLTHHDVQIPGYDEGRIAPRGIDGIDLVINGHIHRRLNEVRAGKTVWWTPGNISRRSRNDACRDHVPSALRLDVSRDGYDLRYIEVPHRPFDEVFYDAVMGTPSDDGASAFVAGLAELQARRTATGAGLMEFLEQNLSQFEPAVANEIMTLAEEVTHEGAI
jgi:DNA repair exonuclease SbcCD nuclease subunit